MYIQSFIKVFPEIFLIFFIFYLLFFILIFSTSKFYKYPNLLINSCWLSVFGLFLVFLLLYNNFNDNFILFNNTFIINYTINSFKILIIIFTIFSIVVSLFFLKKEKFSDFEYIILLLFVTLGNFFLVSSFDLITMYLSIEIQSLSLYVLVTFNKNTHFSSEAGLKYFILGSFASVFLLVGFSIIYFLNGTIQFYDLILLNFIPFNDFFTNYIIVGCIFILSGIFFKLTLAPYHMWSPDVYEGAPMSVSLYMSIVPKIVYFIIFINFFLIVFSNVFLKLQFIFILVSIYSIFIGSFFGLVQKKIKRLLVFSSISHLGFILLSISTGTLEGILYSYLYLIFYSIIVLNLWSIIISVRNKFKNKIAIYLNDINNLTKNNTLIRFILVINLFTISGIPPLIGFWIKFLVILASIDCYLYFPIVFVIFFNAISVFYYIRIIKIFYYDNNFSTNIISNLIVKENSNILISTFFFILFSFIIINFFELLVFKLIQFNF